MSKENYIEEIRPHDSAYKHVSGYAEYTDFFFSSRRRHTRFLYVSWARRCV